MKGGLIEEDKVISNFPFEYRSYITDTLERMPLDVQNEYKELPNIGEHLMKFVIDNFRDKIKDGTLSQEDVEQIPIGETVGHILINEGGGPTILTYLNSR